MTVGYEFLKNYKFCKIQSNSLRFSIIKCLTHLYNILYLLSGYLLFTVTLYLWEFDHRSLQPWKGPRPAKGPGAVASLTSQFIGPSSLARLPSTGELTLLRHARASLPELCCHSNYMNQ